ncbi:MAG: hypothetical protein H6555_07905 [Lewinellaceae bacterium]|nr:hypothetical protein [Lewinellaceae bacterium]
MKIVKRILLILGIFIILFLGAAVAIPYFFKDQIVERARGVINANIQGEINFSDFELTLLRHFPDLTLTMKDFTIEGAEEFAGVKLADIQSLSVSVDFWSIINKTQPIQVTSVEVKSPKLNVLITEAGKANYDLALPDSTAVVADSAAGSTKFMMALDFYKIENGYLYYDDASTNTMVIAKGINHQGSGDFTEVLYDLNTKTDIDSLTVVYDDIKYLNQANTHLDAIFQVDQSTQTYTLKDNILTVNAMKVQGDGFVQLRGDDYFLDLSLSAPENNFRNLLSLVPGAYMEGYENVKASGEFKFDAKIKGLYAAEPLSYPAFFINLSVAGAQVQYPDLPLGITGIVADASIASPGSDLDQMEIDVSKLNLRIGSNPISAVFRLRTPISDPNLDASIKGILDLRELAQAYPMDEPQDLKGRVTADVDIKARMSELDRGEYENVNIRGNLQTSGLTYRATGMPLVQIEQTDMNFSPRYVELKQFSAQLGKSDLTASGRIDNILAYFSPQATMTGTITAQSKLLDVNEWMATAVQPGDAPISAEALSDPDAQPLEDNAIFDRFDFKVDGQIADLRYDNYILKNTVAVGQLSPNRMNIQRAETQLGDSDLQATGVITNVFDYLFSDGTLGGDLRLTAQKFDLNQLMDTYYASSFGRSTGGGGGGGEADPAPAKEAGSSGYDVILIPDNIKMTLDAKAGEVIYTNMTIRNLSGKMAIADQAIELHEIEGNALGGKVTFDGLYDTENPAKPVYAMKMGMSGMDFQKAFSTLNSFKQLAPIGEFIVGHFNTNLVMEGSLKDNMMPDLTNLSVKGFLETISGAIKNFKPLQAIGNSLNIDELRSDILLTNTRNWIEIQNGFLEVKPFDVNVKDIKMTIAGKHGLSQDMNYDIKARIPRKLLEKNPVGATASAGLNAIQQQAGKLGIDFKQGENVDVMITLTGSMQKPQVKFKLLGMDGKSAVADAVEAKVQDEINKQVGAAKAQAQEEVNKLTEQGKAELDKATTKAKEEATKAVDSLKVKAQQELEKKVGEKAGEVLGKPAQEKATQVLDSLKTKVEVDSLKKELEKFNPFKKKKKTGEGSN